MSIDAPTLFGETNVLPEPLSCDRWIARSCFQKAIRRADSALAVRALANLFLHDPKAVWRHLVIVALEDVGVANLDVLEAIIVAREKHSGGRMPGLLWKTFVDLTTQLAASDHDQAVCDLLLMSQNDCRASDVQTTGATREKWAAALYDRSTSMLEKASAALAFGGFTDAPFPADANAVFEILSECALDPNVPLLSRKAWRLCRNPMALLMPIVWNARSARSASSKQDDILPVVDWIEDVPCYAFDQFTRVGKAAIRELAVREADIQTIFREAALEPRQWASVAGDLVFLVEGGLCRHRTVWNEGEALRNPARWLPATSLLGRQLERAMTCIAGKAEQLTQLRKDNFHRCS